MEREQDAAAERLAFFYAKVEVHEPPADMYYGCVLVFGFARDTDAQPTDAYVIDENGVVS